MPMNIKKYLKRFSSTSRQAGFTLLIAALVASIVLSIASAIFSIAQKQIVLASLSQQSQYAFYVADTASECALYWDVRYSYFAPTTPVLPIAPTPPMIPTSPVPPVCGGKSIALATPLSNQAYNQSCYYPPLAVTDPSNPYLPCYIVTTSASQLPAVDLFGDVPNSQAYCAKLTVTKFLDPNGTVHTLIHADGFNTNCASIATSKNALERSVELNY
jgi:hypothetical protein